MSYLSCKTTGYIVYCEELSSITHNHASTQNPLSPIRFEASVWYAVSVILKLRKHLGTHVSFARLAVHPIYDCLHSHAVKELSPKSQSHSIHASKQHSPTPGPNRSVSPSTPHTHVIAACFVTTGYTYDPFVAASVGA